MERIVVGVDGSPNSLAALKWAVSEARTHGASLDAIMIWHEPYYGGMYGGVPIPVSGPEVADSHREHLEKIVDSVDTSGLATPVRQLVLEGTASGGLLASAEEADLLVVGSRGHGGFVGLLLGSVSNQIASHAPCPVVIVPAPPEDD